MPTNNEDKNKRISLVKKTLAKLSGEALREREELYALIDPYNNKRPKDLPDTLVKDIFWVVCRLDMLGECIIKLFTPLVKDELTYHGIIHSDGDLRHLTEDELKKLSSALNDLKTNLGALSTAIEAAIGNEALKDGPLKTVLKTATAKMQEMINSALSDEEGGAIKTISEAARAERAESDAKQAAPASPGAAAGGAASAASDNQPKQQVPTDAVAFFQQPATPPRAV